MRIADTLSFLPRRIFKGAVPIALVLCFSAGLTFLFVLYHPPSPGRYQRIGWQSWEVVSLRPDGSLPPAQGSVGGGPQKGSASNTTEWWDEASPSSDDPVDASSLPLDVWAPLLGHRTGLTEIAIRPCLVNPAYVDFCAPRTTPQEDALKGKWVRVDRDLNWKTGMWYLNVYYRRTRRLDVPLITDIMLLEESEFDKLPQPLTTWNKATGQLRDGVYPAQKDLFLWYKLRHPLAGINVTDSVKLENVITELDVQYGETPYTLWGFTKPNRPVVAKKEGKSDAVWLTYRQGFTKPPKARPLHFTHDGKFKILQIADLHFSVSQGKCRDIDFDSLPPSLGFDSTKSECYGDTLTQTLIKQALEAEKPDLVVFSGDQLNGQTTGWDAYSILAKVVGEVTDAKIPWTVVFGNHDDEADMSRAEQMSMLKSLPYGVAEMENGPGFVDGVGNYVIKVRSADPSKTHLLTLYFLDSHSYTDRGWSFWKPSEYDWLKPSQIEWFLEQSKAINPIERPFTPDGGKDLGKVWRREDDESLESLQTRQSSKKTLAKPNALVFFHIPLPESYEKADTDSSGKALDIGENLDTNGAPKHNSGFFTKALLATKESEDPDSKATEVKVVANGHSHIAENCRRVQGVWLCFGGGGSYSGYGKIGFDRRFRVYDISDFGETIRTYKRTEHGKIVGDSILVGKGAVGKARPVLAV